MTEPRIPRINGDRDHTDESSDLHEAHDVAAVYALVRDLHAQFTTYRKQSEERSRALTAHVLRLNEIMRRQERPAAPIIVAKSAPLWVACALIAGMMVLLVLKR